MKKLAIITSLLSLSFATSAMAQDYYEEGRGLLFGVGLEHNRMEKKGAPPHSQTGFLMDENKTIGRIFVGYDEKILDNTILIGAEIGRTFGDKTLSQTVGTLKYDYEVKPVVDYSARIGAILMDDFIVYGRFGIDTSTMKQTTKLGTDAAKEFKYTRGLGFFGVGAEYNLPNSFVVRGEWSQVMYKSHLRDDKFSLSVGYRY